MCAMFQSCLSFCDPMDYNLPGSSVYGLLQARILEWSPWASPGKNTPYTPPGDPSDAAIKPTSLASPALAGKFTTSSIICPFSGTHKQN